jgi:hypothetical protein
METILTIDLGIIVAALAPTIAILVAAMIAKRDAKLTHEQTADIHALVNDQLTREKAERLALLRAQLLLLKRPPLADEDRDLIMSLESQVAQLAREVEGRDALAAKLAAEKEHI